MCSSGSSVNHWGFRQSSHRTREGKTRICKKTQEEGRNQMMWLNERYSLLIAPHTHLMFSSANILFSVVPALQFCDIFMIFFFIFIFVQIEKCAPKPVDGDPAGDNAVICIFRMMSGEICTLGLLTSLRQTDTCRDAFLWKRCVTWRQTAGVTVTGTLGRWLCECCWSETLESVKKTAAPIKVPFGKASNS